MRTRRTREELNLHRRERYANDPEYRAAKIKCDKENYARNKDGRRNSVLIKKFGITQADYESILEGQGGCAICGREEPDERERGAHFPVDHCHKTDKVRGILCNPCNIGLGTFYDNPKLLLAAVEYLNDQR